MLCSVNIDITAKTNLNGLETTCCLILKLSHLDIIHQEFLGLITVRVCLRTGVTVFLFSVCMFHKREITAFGSMVSHSGVSSSSPSPLGPPLQVSIEKFIIEM